MQSKKGAADDAAAVVDALRRIVHELRVTTHRAEDEVGLSGAQLFVLRELAAEPGISIRRLSGRTLTDPSSVSVVIARLVERGVVTRKVDPTDARRSVLSVGTKGKTILARSPEPYQARLFGALSSLPGSRLRALRLGLSAVVDQTSGAGGSAPLFFEDHTTSTSKPKQRSRRGA